MGIRILAIMPRRCGARTLEKHQCAKRGLARIFAAFAKFRACTLFALSRIPPVFYNHRCPARRARNTRACRVDTRVDARADLLLISQMQRHRAAGHALEFHPLESRRFHER